MVRNILDREDVSPLWLQMRMAERRAKLLEQRRPAAAAHAAAALHAANVQWLASFKEFPPRQKPASFNLDDVMQKMSEQSGGK